MKKITGFFNWILFTRKGNISLWLSIVLLAASMCIILNITSFRLVGLLPPCMLNTLFGIRCAGCGGTRCIQALFSGKIFVALFYNPLLVISIIALLVLFVRFIVGSLKKNYIAPSYSIKPWVAISIGAVFVLFMIIRNFDFYQIFFY